MANNMINPTNNVIIYHYPCHDGFCCAWLFKKMELLMGPMEFIPFNYNYSDEDIENLIDKINERNVFIVDFSFKKNVMERLIKRSNKLVLLDHHKTAQKELIGIVKNVNLKCMNGHDPYINFDMNKSGGQLTWEYLRHWLEHNNIALKDYPNVMFNGIYTWIVNYTADRDLWKWELTDSREINAALRSYPMTFESWNELIRMSLSHLTSEGKGILKFQNQLIEGIVEKAILRKIDGHDALIVNNGVLISEVAEKLAEKVGIGICYFDILNENKTVYSIRSSKEKLNIDVSEIAKRHGGGGHHNAAGWSVPHYFLDQLT